MKSHNGKNTLFESIEMTGNEREEKEILFEKRIIGTRIAYDNRTETNRSMWLKRVEKAKLIKYTEKQSKVELVVVAKFFAFHCSLVNVFVIYLQLKYCSSPHSVWNEKKK